MKSKYKQGLETYLRHDIKRNFEGKILYIDCHGLVPAGN